MNNTLSHLFILVAIIVIGLLLIPPLVNLIIEQIFGINAGLIGRYVSFFVTISVVVWYVLKKVPRN